MVFESINQKEESPKNKDPRWVTSDFKRSLYLQEQSRELAQKKGFGESQGQAAVASPELLRVGR